MSRTQSFKSKHLYSALIAVAAIVTFQNCGQSGSIVDSQAAYKINGITLIGETSIKINNGALYTKSADVMLQISAPGAQKMIIAESESECINSSSWEDYTENKPLTLSDTNKVASIYGRFKKTGVPETDCVRASITHDDIAPQLSVSQKAPAYTNASAVTVKFSASDSGSGLNAVYCKAKNQNEAACSDSYVFSNLSVEGSYDVTIRAVDKAGNESQSVREALIVDRTAPVITINGPQGLTADSNPRYSMSIVESNGLSSVKCRLSPLESALKDCSSLAVSYSNLASGNYQFEVQAVDMAGNSSQKSQSLEVDLNVPSVTLTKVPAALGNMKNVSFEFNGKNGSKALTNFKCSMDSAASAACSSPMSYSNLADKSYSFTVIGINDLGKESSPQSYKFTVDTVAPVVKVVSSPSGRVSSTSASLSMEASDLNGIKSVECSLNGSAFVDCSSKQMTYNALADGNYSFTARATDNAGNTATTAAVSWIVDTTPTSEIIASMAQNPVKEGETGTLNIKLVQVTQASYTCTTLNTKKVVSQGSLAANETAVKFVVDEDLSCVIKGLDKNSAQISKVVDAQVGCGNRLKENYRCADFNCKSVQTLTFNSQNGLNVPARTADGVCYAVKLFSKIANSSSSLNTQIDSEVVSRNHDNGRNPYTHNPYIMGKTMVNFVLGGPRTVKLSGGQSATASILVDNFVLVGLYPQAATPSPLHYLAQGTKDASVDAAGTYVTLKNAQVPLKSFGSSGTATVSPLEIVREADTSLDYVLDIRALDCGGNREMSDIYLLFQ